VIGAYIARRSSRTTLWRCSVWGKEIYGNANLEIISGGFKDWSGDEDPRLQWGGGLDAVMRNVLMSCSAKKFFGMNLSDCNLFSILCSN